MEQENNSASRDPALTLEKPSQVHQVQATKVYLNQDEITPQTSSTNPYYHINAYSHEATTIPPYVLYSIANSKEKSPNEQKHQKQQFNSRNVGQSLLDPFLSSLNNNWGTFFDTVNNTPAYAKGVLNQDIEGLKHLPDLSGKWGGDERLKRCLNSDYNSSLKTSDKKWYQISNSSDSYDEKSYLKSKSKAGYWFAPERRDQWTPCLKKLFLYNNYLPLFFRICIFALSVIALGLSISIFRTSRKKVQLVNSEYGTVSQQPSTIMAICVQCVALAYLIYIAYDEFNAKPLGIRNPLAKIRLLLLDLLFIIFSSANLSLTFNTLYDGRWVCTIDEYSNYPKINSVCERQKALAAFLFMVLVMWVITFTISILRVIEKVSSPNTL